MVVVAVLTKSSWCFNMISWLFDSTLIPDELKLEIFSDNFIRFIMVDRVRKIKSFNAQLKILYLEYLRIVWGLN